MNKTSVAIIGSQSFLAKHLVQKLKYEYTVHIYGRGSSNLENIIFTEFYYPKTNLDLSSIISNDIIIYCAAAGVQSGVITSNDTIYYINTFLPITIVNYLSDNKFKGTFVTFGSYFELGSNKKMHFHSEEEVVRSNYPIINSYSSSKRLLTQFFSNKIYNIAWFHLILPTIYGPGEQSNRLIPYLLSQKHNSERIKLSNGQQIRQYIHVDDVTTFLINNVIQNSVLYPDIYNLTTNDHIRISDITSLGLQITGRDVTDVEIIPKQDESMGVLLLSNEKIKSITGWHASIDLLNGIKSYM